MKKYLPVLLLVILIIPSVAFASWWNPFTWKIFQKKDSAPQVQIETKTAEEKITEMQKQIEDLKKQQTNSASVTTTPVVEKKTAPKIIAPAQVKTNPTPALDYSKYTNPITGKVLTPKEYADIVAPYGINPTTGDFYTLKEILIDGSAKKDTTPYVDLKVNGQDGPITIKVGSVANVTWTSKNVVSCGTSISRPLIGSEKIYIDKGTNNPFVLNCYTSSGTLISDSVSLNIIGDTSVNSDPYNVSSGSGIQYTADQLNSIDCAYYGTNCPTLHIKIDN